MIAHGEWKILHYERSIEKSFILKSLKMRKMVILMQKALVGLYSLSILNPSQSALFTESILD